MGNPRRERQKARRRARRLADDAWKAADRSDLDEAEKRLRHAIKAREGDCVLWCDLGLILWRRGELREAEKAFRASLSLRPEHADARLGLAELLASRGFFRQALRLFEDLSAADTSRETYRRRAGECRARLAELAAAGDAEQEAGMDPT